MGESNEKLQVLKDLAAGKYKVKYEPVDSIGRCVKYDGTVFYVFYDLDGARCSTDLGAFTFVVGNHEFVYDMNDGTWSGDALCEVDEVVEALRQLKEFVDADAYDGDCQWKVYARVNGVDLEADHYWCEDEDCPKDVDEYGHEEVKVPMLYGRGVTEGEEVFWQQMEGVMTDEDLYHLYLLMQRKGDLQKGCLYGEEVKKAYPKLHRRLLAQVAGAACRWKLLLPAAVFEENL